MNSFACPNQPPCEHGGFVHDIYEPGDPYPMCCMDGCRCGHPGDAICIRDADGTVTVEHADPVILVANELLKALAIGIDDVLVLDTAGAYRYRYLRSGRDAQTTVWGREKP